MTILLTVAVTLAVLVVIWTVSWLIVGMRMHDPSGDGRLGILFLAFIWILGPVVLVLDIVSRLRGKQP